MNTNLLLAHGCLKQALKYAYEAEKDLYLDDLLREIDAAIMFADRLTITIDDAIAGVVDDVQAEHEGKNLKPKVDWVNNFIGVVK